MRKNIALVLALVMILSLIPMTAFAATDNRIVPVQEVQDGVEASTTLRITNDRGDLDGLQRIRLTLTNAEFVTEEDEDFLTVIGALEDSVVEEAVSATRIDLTFDVGDEFATGADIDIVFNFEVDDPGEARITITRLAGQITAGTYVFAIAYDGETAVTVTDTVTFGPDDGGVELDDIIIDELVVGAININDSVEGQLGYPLTYTDTFRLRLDRGFEWLTPVLREDVDGLGLAGTALETGVPYPAAAGFNFFGGFEDEGVLVEFTRIAGRDLEFRLWGLNETDAATGVGSIMLLGDGLAQWLLIDEDGGSFGDVNVTFSGAVTTQTRKVAEYADYDIIVERVGDVEEVIAGRFDGEEGDGFELARLRIKENLGDSLVAGRPITVEFPSGIKITDVEVNKSGGDSRTNEALEAAITPSSNRRSFTFTPTRSTGRLDYEFDISVVARADFEGDAVATITGRGLGEDFEVVLGTVIAPITVEMEMTEIVIGESGQMLADITITENVEGALMAGWLGINFDIDGLRVQAGLEVEVDDESGLEIDDVERNYAVEEDERVWEIAVEIDRESDEVPGVLEISNIQVSLGRLPATGDYNVSIGGSALVDNNINNWFPDDEFVWEAPMLRVVTERTVEAAEIAFTIGQMAYMVDGEMKMMDVAPFISEGRIMIPVRYLEELFGMQPIWNPTARTVTVMYNNMVFEMTIGSNMLRVNGAPFMEMDAVATIVDSRTFVPASRFARAMGIDYTWDPATQTATFMH